METCSVCGAKVHHYRIQVTPRGKTKIYCNACWVTQPQFKCHGCGAPLYSLPPGGYCGACVLLGKNTQPPPSNTSRLTCSMCGVSSPPFILTNGLCGSCTKKQSAPPYQQFWQSQYQQQGTQVPKGATNVPTSCRIYWDDSIGGYAVSCSYKPQFIDFLKTSIPASDRAYHPNTKTWTFHEKYFDIMVKMAETIFGAHSVSSQKRVAGKSSIPVGTGSSADPLTIAYAKFARLLPHDVLKKAYREAASVLHPDKDPSNAQRMADLNEVWAQIKATLP